MALFSCYSGLARQDLIFHELDSIGPSRKTASENYCKTLSAIQRLCNNPAFHSQNNGKKKFYT
jgi:hypothetical protein